MLIFSMFSIPLVIIILLGTIFMSGAAGSISENPDLLDESAANPARPEVSRSNPEGLLNSHLLM